MSDSENKVPLRCLGSKGQCPWAFPGQEEYGSGQKGGHSEGTACACFGWTPCCFTVAFCQAAGAVLACFLVGPISRRPLDAPEPWLSAARCPFCLQVQQSIKRGGSLAPRWPHKRCGSLPAGVVCCQASPAPSPAGQGTSPGRQLQGSFGAGGFRRQGPVESGLLGCWAARGAGYLFGDPGIHLSQLRTRPHLNWSWFSPPWKKDIIILLMLGINKGTNNASLGVGMGHSYFSSLSLV